MGSLDPGALRLSVWRALEQCWIVAGRCWAGLELQVPSVVGSLLVAMSFPEQEGGPRMRFWVSVSPAAVAVQEFFFIVGPTYRLSLRLWNLNHILGDHEVPAPALAGTELERQLPGSGSSLKPPASANQLGEIQTARWLTFPAWQASVCTWRRRDGGRHT